jgi:hypothetical protein
MRIDLDTAQLDRNTFYELLTATVVPRPIAWAATTSAAGTDDLAPATFGGKRYRWLSARADTGRRQDGNLLLVDRVPRQGRFPGRGLAGGPRCHAPA